MTMSEEAALLEALNNAVLAWSDDFIFSTKHDPDYSDGPEKYFQVTVVHRAIPGVDHGFLALVKDDGECQMEFYEEHWEDIDQGSLFAFMWFDAAERAGRRDR